MEKLKSKLIAYSESRGGCESFTNALRNTRSLAQIVRLYKTCPEWFIENKFPDVDFLRENFDLEELANLGLFVDKKFNGERLDSHIYLIFHNCSGSINTGLNIEKAIIPTLYLATDTKLKIEVDEKISIPVFLFDTAKYTSDGKIKLRKSTPDVISDVDFEIKLENEKL